MTNRVSNAAAPAVDDPFVADPSSFHFIWLERVLATEDLRFEPLHSASPRVLRAVVDGSNPEIRGMGAILWSREGAKRYLAGISASPTFQTLCFFSIPSHVVTPH